MLIVQASVWQQNAWWKQVKARPTEGRTFLPGEASGAFCATAFFEDVYEEQDEDDTIHQTS